MPRLTAKDFGTRFVDYIRAVHDVVEDRLAKAGEAFSRLTSRASALMGRLVAGAAERALRTCIDPLLRDDKVREAIETVFEEMGSFIELVQTSVPPPEGETSPNQTRASSEHPTAREPLRMASTINKSITSLFEKLPFWFKALLEAFNELVEIARRE